MSDIRVNALARATRRDDISRFGPYDLMLGTVGYESRARYIPEKLHPVARVRIAAGFPIGHSLSYEENERRFGELGFDTVSLKDDAYGEWVRAALRSTQDSSTRIRVGVDISSMSRVRIAATLIELVRAAADNRTVEADLLYAPAAYDPPPVEDPPISICEPVLPGLAGWSSEPSMPSAVVIGLGYEHDKAVGALEYLEPAAVWGFVPRSEDRRYDSAVRRANQSLWSFRPPPHEVHYPVMDPFRCFVGLESLTHGLLDRYRPILVPFGPKIFALCCVLVAIIHKPNIAVWRVSSGALDVPVDRQANGRIVGLRLTVTPDEAPDPNV